MKFLLKAAMAGALTAASMFAYQYRAKAQVADPEPCDHFSYMQTEDGTCIDLSYMSRGGNPSAGGIPTTSPMASRFIAALQKLDIPVNYEDCEPGLLGSYNYALNEMRICQNNVKDDEALYIETLAHETWHLVQDMYAGLENSVTVPVTLASGDYEGYDIMASSLDFNNIMNILENYDGENHPFEVEAYFMESRPEAVLEVLEGLASL